MANSIWKRERHARRIAARRLGLQLYRFLQLYRSKFRHWSSPEVAQAWPRTCWTLIGQFDQHWEAQVCASRHPASRLLTIRRTRNGRTRIICLRVGYVQRRGAPFRTAAMTWELEARQRQHQHRLARASGRRAQRRCVRGYTTVPPALAAGRAGGVPADPAG